MASAAVSSDTCPSSPEPPLQKRSTLPTDNVEFRDAERAESCAVLGEGSAASSSFEVVRNFQPAWFAMTMGWGMVALMVDGIPGPTGTFDSVLNWIGLVVWIWNSVYWFLFAALFTARVFKYPNEVWKMMLHPAQPMFIGCIPMGFTSFTLGWVLFGPRLMPEGIAAEIAHGCWWFMACMSVASLLVPTYFQFVHQQHSIASMTSLWLLPVVANVVTAAAGATIGPHLTTLDGRTTMFFASVVLWGSGVLSAVCIIAVYYTKLTIDGFPPAQLGHSNWVVVGPIGQGANAIMGLGRNCHALYLEGAFKTPALHSLGEMSMGGTTLLGLSMWGVGLFWMVVSAYISISFTRKYKWLKRRLIGTPDDHQGMRYSLGWWAVIFPFGTMVLATNQLSFNTDFMFFHVTAQVLGVTLIILALYVHIKTIIYVVTGRIWGLFK